MRGHKLKKLFIGPESDLEAGRWVVETKAANRGDDDKDFKKEDEGYIWHLPETKNGTARDVAPLPEAEALAFELMDVAPKRRDVYVFGDPDLPASEGGFNTNLVTMAHRNAAIRSGYRDPGDTEGDIEDDELDRDLDKIAIGAVLETDSEGEKKVELKGKSTNHDLRHTAITMLAKFHPTFSNSKKSRTIKR
ncbi:MAG: hypothetical protein IPK59_18490 [Rhodospirillaceae bacterium]|nr:hypothetical protein [Rhodospirillaceae bacterium]